MPARSGTTTLVKGVLDNWINFYEPFFQDREAARRFVESLEQLGPDDLRHPAKIMMHQAQRLISLADDMPQIRSHIDSLQLLFLLICGEHIGKLYDNFDGEGRSRAYTRQFFETLVSEQDRQWLKKGFNHIDRTPMEIQEVADLLYDVRCDVVHEGNYWRFHFSDGRTPLLNTDPDVIVNLRLADLRDIVVRGCINAIQSYEGGPNQ